MDFDSLAKKCRKLAYEGKEYEEILNEISVDKLDNDKKNELLSLIDDFIVQYNLEEQVKSKHRTQMMLGIIVLILGLFILIFTYLRKESQYSIGLFVTIIGIYFTKKGYDQLNQNIGFQNISPEKESIFKKY